MTQFIFITFFMMTYVSNVIGIFETALTIVSTSASTVVGYKMGQYIDQKRALTGAVLGACTGVSLAKGIQNSLQDQETFEHCKKLYGLMELNNFDQHYNHYFPDYRMREIYKRVLSLDALDSEIIWNFEKFKQQIPHSKIQGYYCISKHYINLFESQTLGHLHHNIAMQIAELEQDIIAMMKLTDCYTWLGSNVIPKNCLEFNRMQLQLLEGYHFGGSYILLGMFGYSFFQNHYAVKCCLVSMVKLYNYLLRLQTLLNNCLDDHVTQLDDLQGYLRFAW